MLKNKESQTELFGEEFEKKYPHADNTFLWNQFCKLGEMMGDGLHYEADGRWIAKEYKQLSRILIPEIKEVEQKRRKRKAENIDEQMKKLLMETRYKCGGILVQKRNGVKVAYCTLCNARYVAGKKK